MNDSAALPVGIDIETLSAFLYLSQRAAQRRRSGNRPAAIKEEKMEREWEG